ncbi:MAG: flagellar hook-associated protein FlgL [Clostridia bacterium]|nr:flagellar hook-associated protein FlgL [Clostridia bacterium]
MRITNNMLVNNMMNSIGKNLTRMEKYENQLSSGKKIQVPSDDPVVAARSLKLRTDVAEIEQYKRNIKDAQSWLDITETTIGQVGEILQRARDLAVQAANGVFTSEETQKIREEVKQLKAQVTHISNTTYAGRYIFSGYKTNQKIMDENGSFIINVNNSEKIKFEIGVGDDIDVNVPGGDLFNSGANAVAGPAPVGGLIDGFNRFINALTTADNAGTNEAIANIDKGIDNVLRIQADVGARQNRLELTANRMESDTLNFTKLMSDNEDVDMAETIMNLKNEENVYRASLAGGARIIQPTLVDFLR